MRFREASYQFGPGITPPAIKNLILYTTLATIAVALLTPFFHFFLNMTGPEEWFSLSWGGVFQDYFLWQPATFLFVRYTAGYGIGLSFLITLFFQMYLLWITGTQVLERVGQKSFLRLYFTAGILAGLFTLFLMPLSGQYQYLSGPSPAILAVLVVWTFLFPETDLFLFFIIPIKAKWLTAGIIGALFLISLSALDLPSFFLYLFSCSMGFIYAVAAWGLSSPFPHFQKIESWIIAFFGKVTRKTKKRGGNVIDIITGEPKLDDEKFVDMILEKISKHGQGSLSRKERQRMDEISEMKRRQK